MDDGLKRVIRLVGDGRNEMSGGGLPLTDAFTAVLQHLLDAGGPVLLRELTGEVMRVMRMKEKRIFAIWGSWDAFSDDIITQLGCQGLLKVASQYPEEWERSRATLAEDFTPGEAYEVIPGAEMVRAGHEDIPVMVTVFDAAARRRREEAAKLTMALNGFRVKVQRAGQMTPYIEKMIEGVRVALEGPTEDGRPPKPPDEPETEELCPGCKQWKAKTRRNFIIYWSRDQWYWRVNCRDCMTPPKIKKFQERLAKAVRDLIAENNGTIPSVSDVQEKMGESTRTAIATSWDRLAAREFLPFRKE